jgi:hypothetical protein
MGTGALLGLIGGVIIEKTFLIDFFAGQPSVILNQGLFPLFGGILGAVLGALAEKVVRHLHSSPSN